MIKPEDKGIFTLSLDFELAWGLRSEKELQDYKENIIGARKAVPALLDIFEEYGIRATWACVGILLLSGKGELIRRLNEAGLDYSKTGYFSGRQMESIGESEESDPYHYAPSLIKRITASSGQEIATHTFSHYFCKERTAEAVGLFKKDAAAAIKASNDSGISVQSIVFPGNIYSSEYIAAAKELGLRAYRGNEEAWIYSRESYINRGFLVRAWRFLDIYLNIFGYSLYSPDDVKKELPINLPSSRCLRPFRKKFGLLELMKIDRILSEMTYAAKEGLIYHIWFHPHNFGKDLNENMQMLRKILDHYAGLKKTYGMESLNMADISGRIMR